MTQNYQKSIMAQIPTSYTAENVVLNIELKLDLAKIFRTNRFIGTALVSQFPSFEEASRRTIGQFLKEKGLA